MKKSFDYLVLVYYYSSNTISYNFPLKNKRRVKVWVAKDPLLTTGIEFVFLDEKDILMLGDFGKVHINVSNKVFFETLINSGYKVFFGEIVDIRLGEIISILERPSCS